MGNGTRVERHRDWISLRCKTSGWEFDNWVRTGNRQWLDMADNGRKAIIKRAGKLPEGEVLVGICNGCACGEKRP